MSRLLSRVAAPIRSHCRTFQPNATVAYPLHRALPLASTHTFTHRPSSHFSTSATAPSEQRPFRVLGLQQIAIGGLSKSALSRLWVDTLGVNRSHTFQSERENVDEDICTLGSGPHSIEIDLMQPLDASKSPKVHVPPLNHIGVWVDDLPKAVDYLTKKGMRFTPGGIRKGASGFDVCFIHPKGNADFPLSGEGVLIELVQAPKEVIDAHSKQ